MVHNRSRFAGPSIDYLPKMVSTTQVISWTRGVIGPKFQSNACNQLNPATMNLVGEQICSLDDGLKVLCVFQDLKSWKCTFKMRLCSSWEYSVHFPFAQSDWLVRLILVCSRLIFNTEVGQSRRKVRFCHIFSIGRPHFSYSIFSSRIVFLIFFPIVNSSTPRWGIFMCSSNVGFLTLIRNFRVRWSYFHLYRNLLVVH